MGSKLSLNKSYALMPKVASSILSCMKRSMASSSPGRDYPLYSALLRLHLLYYVQFSPIPQHEKDINKLEHIQQRTTKMAEKLEHLPYQRRIWLLQPGEQMALGGLNSSPAVPMRRQLMESGSSQ